MINTAYSIFLNQLVTKKALEQFFKYLVIGGMSTSVDYLLLYSFVEYFKLNYIISSLLSFSTAIIINYMLCKKYLFTNLNQRNYMQELLLYFIVSSIGMVVNTLFIWFFTEHLLFHYMYSKTFATIVIVVWNFSGRKYLIHKS